MQMTINSNANANNAGLEFIAPEPLLLSVFVAAAVPSEPVAPVDCAPFDRVALCAFVPEPVLDSEESSEAAVLTSPCDAAVTMTPSTLTAEPPCEIVWVVDASRTTQLPLASCEPVMVLSPMVRTLLVSCMVIIPLPSAVRVTEPI